MKGDGPKGLYLRARQAWREAHPDQPGLEMPPELVDIAQNFEKKMRG